MIGPRQCRHLGTLFAAAVAAGREGGREGRKWVWRCNSIFIDVDVPASPLRLL